MLTEQHTLYDILGVEPNAPPQKIKAIYQLRSRETYPRRPGVGNEELQKDLNRAYNILKDPQKRREYNEQIGLRSQPRSLKTGKPMYQEIVLNHQDANQPIPYTFKRWEPCPRCWGEGCIFCQNKGKRPETITLTVAIPAGISQYWIKGQGIASEPGSSRGDLILYVVWKENEAKTR